MTGRQPLPTLAIATATGQIGVAVAGPDGRSGSVSVRAGRRHGETLAPAIESLLRLTGVELARIERVAVDVGPGLFTGLRVGVATAKALASALSLPVVPVSSLDILAHPHRGAGRPVASVVDARRGEVFWTLYEPVGGAMAAVTEPAVVAPADLAVELRRLPGDLLLTGDGARRWFAGPAGTADSPGTAGPSGPAGPSGTAEPSGPAADGEVLAGFDVAPEEFDHPAAAVLLDLAGTRPDVAAEKVTPSYLRGADVRIGWEQR